MRRAVTWLVVLGLSSSAWGQWGPTVVPREPLDPNAKLPALSFTRVRIETTVLAHLAETRATLTIHNPHTAQVEGDLHFALPSGAVVNGYALDVNGEMVDGVAVDKEEGRRVFDDIVVRQRKDPGLIEHAGGGEFNVRIFPIPAKGERTVSVRYLCELPVEKDGAVLELPLRFKEKLDEAAIRVDVIGAATEPNVASGGPWALRFAGRFVGAGQWPNRTIRTSGYVAQADIWDGPAVGNVKIVIPLPGQGWSWTEEAPDETCYFLVQDFPSPMAGHSLPPPERVTILWDASGSRASGDHEKEMEVLRRYFAAMPNRSVEVDLVVFRHVAGEPRRFTIDKGDASTLLAELRKVAYDGGTRLACVPPPTSKPPDLYLLFSDGKNTFDHVVSPVFGRHLYAFSGDRFPDRSLLRGLAGRTGGDYFDLAEVEPARAAKEIGRLRARMLDASCLMSAEAEVYPRGPQEMGGRVLLVGRAPRLGTGQVTLSYGDRVGSPREVPLAVSRFRAVKGEMLRRYWAQRKLADLLAAPSPHVEEIAALGKEYSLVTPYTSLMVLETVDQYVRYGIVPPQSQPAMRAEYARQVASSPAEDPNVPFDTCAGLWEARRQWANPPPPPSGLFGEVPTQGPRKYVKPKLQKTPPGGESTGIFGGSSGGIFGSSGGTNSVSAMNDARLPLPERMSGGTGAPGERGPLPLPSRSRSEPPERARGQDWPGRWGGLARYTVDANISCLAALVAAPADRWMGIYLATRERAGYGPTLFLESGDFLLRHGRRADGLRVLSNLAEHYWDSTLLLRWQARYLVRLGMWEEAVALLEEIHARDGQDPIACRELALALAGRAYQLCHRSYPPGGTLPARADYARAIELLYRLALRSRDAADRVLFLTDLGGVLARARGAGMADLSGPVDSRLREPLQADLRVVLTGEFAGGAALEVRTPYAEEDFPAGRKLAAWSNCSCGAQEYVLRKAFTGTYTVRVRRWGGSSYRREVAHVEVVTDFGRPTERRRYYTVLLPKTLGTYTIAEVYF